MISADDNREVYLGAGTRGPFTIPFYFLDNAHIKAVKTHIITLVETPLVLTTDFTLTGVGNPDGGALTLTIGHGNLSSSYKLTIYRDPDALQLTDLTPYDKFPAESVEATVDKATMLIQRLREVIASFVPKLSDGDISGMSLALPTPVALGVLRVKSDKSGLEWVFVSADGAIVAKEAIVIACSAEAEALTAGTDKVKLRMPFGFTLTAVRASLSTAQTGGNIFTIDINEGGVSILSTKLTIDNGETTSVDAAAQPVMSDTALADNAEISIDVDQIGDGTAKGLKVTLIGRKT